MPRDVGRSLRALAERHDGDGAIRRDAGRCGRRNADRAAVTQDGLSGGGQELARGIDVQIARARIGLLAVRILNGDVAGSAHGNIQRIAGRDLRPHRAVPADGRVRGVDARGIAGTGQSLTAETRSDRPESRSCSRWRDCGCSPPERASSPSRPTSRHTATCP